MPLSLGLDIGSSSLKAVELEEKDGHFALVNFGSVPSPPGAIFSEADADQEALTKAIIHLTREIGIKTKQVVAAFPESLVFTRVIELPVVKEKQLNNAIRWEAEQYIPMPLSDVKMSWMRLTTSEDGKSQVLLVAAPNTLVERYLKIIKSAGLVPIAFETELVAIVRSLSRRTDGEGPTTLMMSIGASTTDLTIVDGGVIRFTRSIGTGGTALSRAISQELGFDLAQAEEYKKAYGLKEDQLEGKVMQTIKPVFDVIVNEVERVILSFQTHNPSSVVKRVILTGGTAQLPGAEIYLAESLGVEVQIGDPWVGIEIPRSRQDEVKRPENRLQFAIAIGLAMKGD